MKRQAQIKVVVAGPQFGEATCLPIPSTLGVSPEYAQWAGGLR